MSARPIGPCSDLSTMSRAYDDDKRIPVVIPLKAFRGPKGGFSVDPGDAVDVVGFFDYSGNVVEESGRAEGRVKRILVEVVVDMATYHEGQPVGQDSLAGGSWE